MHYVRPVVYLRLRRLLKAKGMTAYRLAKEAGLSLTTIYRLTRPSGRFTLIRAETMDRLCAVLDCQVGDLFERLHEKPSRHH